MKNFFKSAKFKIILCVFVALLAGMIFGAFTNDASSPFTSAASVIYAPFQKAASVVAQKLDRFKSSFVSASTYRDKAAELESENNVLNDELVDYERTKQKLSAYEEFLEVKEDHPDYKFTPSSIVSANTSDVYNSFTLDKGSTDGVKVNSPVISGSNVVGLVKEVAATTCTVKTILDPSLNISVYEIKSRENGYSTTTAALAYEGLCRMSGLTKETAVAAGGIVCTSGLGGIFPRDLIVGNISEVRNEATDVSVYAVIKPAVDINSLVDVFIITGFDGQSEG